jgi:hypothetical protein
MGAGQVLGDDCRAEGGATGTGTKMSRRSDSQKASGLLRDHVPVFGGRTLLLERAFPGLEAAFPGVKAIRVEYEESGGIGFSPTTRTMFLRDGQLAEVFDCGNNRCRGGGFSIREIVTSMIETRVPSTERDKPCRGNEGSPKGRKIYGPCSHRFNIRVTISFQSATADSCMADSVVF